MCVCVREREREREKERDLAHVLDNYEVKKGLQEKSVHHLGHSLAPGNKLKVNKSKLSDSYRQNDPLVLGSIRGHPTLFSPDRYCYYTRALKWFEWDGKGTEAAFALLTQTSRV